MRTCINSEIGKLESVIIHTPGSEVENMTPENAERALYSDILNLSIASREYVQLSGVLKKVSPVYEVKNLFTDILQEETIKSRLIEDICRHEGILELRDILASSSPEKIASMLIEGILRERNTLTNYFSNEKFLLRPLHNLFFTRDSAMGMNDKMLIGRMANPVRERETLIMDAIFSYHPLFDTTLLNPLKPDSGIFNDKKATIEGGDFQVIRKDILLIGTGMRTSTQGIDFIVENIKKNWSGVFHIIIQELPSTPESFIHLDMVFTCLSMDTCMTYNPVIYNLSRYKTLAIRIDNGNVRIEEQPNIPAALKNLGVDLKSIPCGGAHDPWIQEREQWHSGANFFAIAPGKLIGYERNVNTLEALNKNGYEIVTAADVIKGVVSVDKTPRCVITIAGSELARGGGGARCMTMPVRRAKVDW